MRNVIHIKRAVLKGYGPAKEHTFDPRSEACIVCGKPRLIMEDKPVDCFPKFGGEEK